MNPIQPNPTPLSGDHDASYHYLYGRHQLCRYLPASEQSQLYPSPTAEYDFSRQAVSALEDQGPQTVEQLISQGYFAVPAEPPETAILSDRRATAWLGLDDVIRQVQRRFEIYEQNIYEIDLAKCEAINALFVSESHYGWPASAKEQYILGKRLQALYADQREERVSVWKDVSRLRQSLPENAQQYLSAHRKIQILDEPGGDLS